MEREDMAPEGSFSDCEKDLIHSEAAMGTINERFQKTEDEYFRLRGQLGAGRITQQQFETALKDLMFEYEGRYWMIGTNSGQWQAYDGQKWKPAAPPLVGVPTGEPKPAKAKTAPAATQGAEIRRFEGVAPQPSPQSSAQRSPRLTVRGWFRALTASAGGGALPIELEHVRALAGVLWHLYEAKLISDHEFRALYAALCFKGPGDTLWTVELGSMRWQRREQGKWEPADAPEWVYLDMKLLEELVAVMPTQPRLGLLH
jgi:hypothetical protein